MAEVAKSDVFSPKVVTGSRVGFYIGSIKIAYASNVSYNENITYEPINVLDRLDVVEHAETGYTVDLQCQNFRILKTSIKNLGIMPQFDKILTQGELKAHVSIDDGNGSLINIVEIEGVKLQARQTTVDARGVMTETWSFVGKKSSDESLL